MDPGRCRVYAYIAGHSLSMLWCITLVGTSVFFMGYNVVLVSFDSTHNLAFDGDGDTFTRE